MLFGGDVVSSGRLALLPCLLFAVASVANCGGQSSLSESNDDDGTSGTSGAGGDAGAKTTGGSFPTGGDAGAVSSGGFTTGGTATGGFTTGGSSTGGAGGSPLDPEVRCRMPVTFAACPTRSREYWFDATTGLCMPFDYYGCASNENRFVTPWECYAVCGGRGDNDFAACEDSAECWPKRLSEPCCSLDLREFVGVNRNFNFTCSEPRICTSCAADCDYVPPDGYIGATCNAGYCVAFDASELYGTACMTDADCYLRYGVECCSDCSSEQYPSKLVALASSFDLDELACGEAMSCDDTCDYDGFIARCSESFQCEVLPTLR